MWNPLEQDSIVEQVLSFLPMKDLHCVARISKMWNAEARKQKSTRFGIKSLSSSILTMDNVSEQINSLNFEPKYVLCVTQKVNQANNRSLCQSLANMALPPHCQCILLGVSNGLFHDKANGKKSAHSKTNFGQFLILPSFPSFKIHTLYNDRMEEFVASTNFHPKLIIRIVTPQFELMVRDDVLAALATDTPAIGCTVASISHITSGDAAGSVCLFFEGGEMQVQTQTITSKLCGRSPEKVEKRKDLIKRLGADMRSANRICFMFTCCGVKVSGKHEREENAALFHAIYPHVPLFGMYCLGEWGREGPALHLSPARMGYTTVMAMVSLAQ